MPVPFYNTSAPTPSTMNTITSIATGGIRDYLLNKCLLPQYPQLTTSLNGSPRIGEPVLDTMVGTGNNLIPFGLPLETNGILRMQNNIIANRYINVATNASTLLTIQNTPASVGSFPNSTFPNGIDSYPTSSNGDIDTYGILAKTTDAGYLKDSTLLNLYVDTDEQVDVSGWLNLQSDTST